MSVRDSVFILINGDESTDELIVDTIINLTRSRLLNLLDTDELDESLEYIVIEVSVARFNRIGSEGTTSHSVGGESMTFSDDDFQAYSEDISNWKKRHKNTGYLRFI